MNEQIKGCRSRVTMAARRTVERAMFNLVVNKRRCKRRSAERASGRDTL